ncbi:MAG TPA: N-acetylmuramoyl-L-alanine amidase, partial [Prosthecochloris aestuarii]|nr:N-acetylmuramoyl-L-alanine amidase [Prosthecochloris aestuarii]
AMMENAVIKQEADYEERYRGFSEEYTIISSLAQNAFTLQSTEAARYVLEGLQEKTKLNDRGVRQAGFVVLWTPSMPSILVEAGYLSNHEEERVLRQKSTQQAIAKGIFNGLDRYREQYERQQVAAASAMP